MPRRQAQENFQYFMRVRRNRSEYLRCWLERFFDVRLEGGAAGVAALDRWARDYAGLLLPNRRVARSYYSYELPWSGQGAGCSVLFDMGITLGEWMIAESPALLWDMDPMSTLWPKQAASFARRFGSGFQRPTLARFDLPNWGRDPLGDVFACAAAARAGARFSLWRDDSPGAQGLAQAFAGKLVDLRDRPLARVPAEPALGFFGGSLRRAWAAAAG